MKLETLNDEHRIIHGIASCADQDLQGDVLAPTNAEFILPVPLYFQHDANQRIGSVFSAEVTAAGIEIKAEVSRGVAFAESVWTSLKAGALGALSVGFRALENPTSIKGGGLRWGAWQMIEVSVCELPANVACQIKSLDQEYLPARPGFHLQSLEELNAEFCVSETMTPEIYQEKRDAILKLNARRSARLAVTPVNSETGAVTRDYLRDVVKKILVNSFTRDAALSKRVESLEAVIERPELGDVAVVRALERLEDWFSATVLPIYDDHGRIVGAKRDVTNVKAKTSPSIDQRLRDLESKPAVSYRGVWGANESYETGEQVTCKGGLWICREATKSRPGEGPEWKLIVKSGRAR